MEKRNHSDSWDKGISLSICRFISVAAHLHYSEGGHIVVNEGIKGTIHSFLCASVSPAGMASEPLDNMDSLFCPLSTPSPCRALRLRSQAIPSPGDAAPVPEHSSWWVRRCVSGGATLSTFSHTFRVAFPLPNLICVVLVNILTKLHSPPTIITLFF